MQTLTITDSTIDHDFGGIGGTSNSGSGGGGGGNGGSGGGISSAGNAVISDSTIASNGGGTGGVGPGASPELGSGGSGGGICVSGSLTLVNSTVSGNHAGDPAGTVSSVLANGGGIDSTGPLRLTNCTVSANSTHLTEGAGLYVGAHAVLNNTIVASNVYIGLPVLRDVFGAVDPASAYNLIGDGSGMTGMTVANHNQIGADQSRIDPKLAPLGDFGGPTQTMAPSPDSPVIDAGSNALAVGPDGTPLMTDQRGFARVVDATHTGTPTVDIGAVEVAAFPTSPFVVTTTADPPWTDYGPNQLLFHQAILFTNALGGPAMITFAPGLADYIQGNFELFDTTGKVTIQGPGLNGLTIGSLQVDAKVNAEIDGLETGSLANSGTLVLNSVSITGGVTNNGSITANDSGSGGISNRGTITFTKGVVNGLFTNEGTANLSDTTVGGEITNGISHLLSFLQCGIIAPIGNSGTLAADHSSVSGRITNDGTVTISNSAIGGGGGGSISNSGTLTLANAILTGTLLDALDNNGTATLNDYMVSFSHGVGVNNAAGGSLTVSGGAVMKNIGGGVSGSATISNCQITNNGGTGVSGQTLVLTNCTISGNKGDGIDVTGNLRADSCAVQHNAGRGVSEAASSSDVLSACTIGGNQSPASGGGIENSGTALLANCTISGNTAAAGSATGAEISGGGIDNSGTLRLTNCTVANNYANAGMSPTNDATGGGIYIAAGHVTLNNSIVAGNYAVAAVGGSPPDDIVGAVGPSSAYNLISYAPGATGLSAANHNLLGTAANPIDPKLSPLTDNGGPTQTMALLAGSPAIDAGSNALAVGPDGKPLLTDQHGYYRIFNGTVDIGAVEYGSSPLLPGDANADGKVDFADLVVVARHYGKTPSLAAADAAMFSASVVGTAPSSSAATLLDVAGLPHHRRRP